MKITPSGLKFFLNHISSSSGPLYLKIRLQSTMMIYMYLLYNKICPVEILVSESGYTSLVKTLPNCSKTEF